MKNNFYSFIIGVLVALYMMHDIPAISIIYPKVLYAIVVFGCFGSLVISVSWNKGSNMLPLFIIPILGIIFGHDMDIFKKNVGIAQLMIYPMAGIYVVQSGNKKLGVWLIALFLLAQIITCVTTIIGLERFPLACRMQAMGEASEMEEYGVFRALNIGGFDFIYGLTVLFPLIILTWQNRALLFERTAFRKVLNIIVLAILFLVFYTVIKSQFTTASVVCVFPFLLFFIRKKLSWEKIILVSIVVVILFSLFKTAIGDAIAFIANNVESEVVHERLYDTALSLQGKTTEGQDFDERQLVWERAITTFVNNPFGTWGGGTGGHSVWLDALALYGISAFLFIFIFLFTINKFFLRPISDYSIYNCVVFTCACFLLTSFFNPQLFFNILLFVLPIYLFVFYNIRLVQK